MASDGGQEPALDLASLYRDLHPGLLRHVRRMAPRGAEDLAADVWIETAAGLSRFDGDAAAFSGWLYTLARRRAIDASRRATRQRTDVVAHHTLDARAGPDRPDADVVELLASGAAMRRVAGMLTEAQAEVILLRVVAGLRVEEVAAITGRPMGAVRGLQHRGLRRLAEGLPREALSA